MFAIFVTNVCGLPRNYFLLILSKFNLFFHSYKIYAMFLYRKDLFPKYLFQINKLWLCKFNRKNHFQPINTICNKVKWIWTKNHLKVIWIIVENARSPPKVLLSWQGKIELIKDCSKIWKIDLWKCNLCEISGKFP